MHSVGLVFGDNVDEQLEPFSDGYEAERRLVFVEEETIAAMAEKYGIARDDLEGLRDKLEDWTGEEGVIEDGKLAYWTEENPNARFDWYEVGGKWSGYLKLKQPRKLFLGILKRFSVNEARIEELDNEHLRELVPQFLLKDGQWYENPASLVEQFDGVVPDEWVKQYHTLLDNTPKGTMLTVIDLHS